MKKLSVALLLALTASSAFSQTVASANVLGYTKVIDPASNRMVLVAVPFNSGTGTVSTLLDVFGTNQLRQSFLNTRCDKVTTWDVASQSYVQYVQKTNGNFYYYTNFNGTAVNPIVTRGQALWMQAPSATYAPTEKTVIFSGNTPNDESYTNPITGNSQKPMNFIANPYPVEVELSSLINTNDGAKGSFLNTKADLIHVWSVEAQNYTTFALKTPTNKWYYYTNFTASSAPSVKIKPGQGFWYQTTNSFSWIETKSYTLE